LINYLDYPVKISGIWPQWIIVEKWPLTESVRAAEPIELT
jgi:hypothetical protein